MSFKFYYSCLPASGEPPGGALVFDSAVTVLFIVSNEPEMALIEPSCGVDRRLELGNRATRADNTIPSQR